MRLGKKLAAAVLSGILSIGLAITQTVTAAPLTNGGFETSPSGSSFTGWTNIGSNVTQTDNNYLSVIPEGSFSALFSNGTTPIYSALGGSTTNLSAANTALGITGNQNLATNNANDVSGVYQTFDVAVASTLSFSFAFATNEGPNLDFGFLSINGKDLVLLANSSSASTLTSTAPTTLDFIAGDFAKWTGFQTYAVNLAAGTYTVGFGASNVPSGVGVNSSALIVDNLVVSPSVVPIPSSVLAGMALFGGLGMMQIARRRKTAVLA